MQNVEQAVLTGSSTSPDADEIADAVCNAGISGAGGAGFPSYMKWQALDDVQYLMVNHQESEPNFYGDKWLLRERTEELAAFLETLTEQLFDAVVIGAKAKDRDKWMQEFEAATDATTYDPDELPADVEQDSGVVITYTDDKFQYGMEQVLLPTTTGTAIAGDNVPTDHGWIVHNTESLYNVYRALVDDAPVTRKLVHVGIDVPRHRFLQVPVGTPSSVLLEAAETSLEAVQDEKVALKGGPGWCFEVDDLAEFTVTKATNGLLLSSPETVEEHRLGEERIDLLDVDDWDDDNHETTPSTISPERVRIPMITNPAYEGLVKPSEPVVTEGQDVTEGDVVAEPAADGISIAQHASIDGTVTDVTDTHVEIERN